ncbi:unnamed protein product [Bemisia tabaci]|uniref:ubiquitinyl hydrolase 1 n=1 Tax=Bemisia tabaci TaxID=7038 RepID=A0A9P0F2A1_BEMTA|nr:PREDICTED: ubiquitin carboxyl-terminal hydrolase 22 [Bemisia tabaci]CAH0388905.1 unnamed protein product [Bemisia tabaci]
MGETGCIHLKNFKAAKGVDHYETISSIFTWPTSPKYRKAKALCCFCHICQYRGPLLLTCLHCIHFACFGGKHIHEHSKSKKHFLAVNVSFGNIFCFQCGDYVYDKELFHINQKNKATAYKSLGLPYINTYKDPYSTEKTLLRLNPVKKPATNYGAVGLRGLLNLGDTCFINSIVQALTHTPLLRDYFLSKNHVCHFEDDRTKCLVCEIVNLFQEFYSGLDSPLILHRFLHLIWTHARHLAGYEQQDAHEFFIATLNVLHQQCKDTSQAPNGDIPKNSNHCTCIIDQIFTGDLQSDVVCQACNGVSTTVDPFWDISLDLSGGVAVEKETKDQKPLTLADCLRQFTRQEHLGSKIKCNNCNSYQESTKQLSMQKLPVVACFHLKRFEHSKIVKKKITTSVSFPEFLDMTPFLSEHRQAVANGLDLYPPHLSSEDNRYSLFAVVNHIGSLDLGHYTAFIRHKKDQWFKCNDDHITQVKKSDVLASEGYLLFYHKRILEYE